MSARSLFRKARPPRLTARSRPAVRPDRPGARPLRRKEEGSIDVILIVVVVAGHGCFFPPTKTGCPRFLRPCPPRAPNRGDRRAG